MSELLLRDLRCCAWRTVSYRATDMAAARALIEGAHPQEAIVASCQRLEAYGFGPCDCPAPERLTGPAALEHLAGVAAGLESVVLGENQVIGQVRAAFKTSPRELRRLADLAVGAARTLRSETCFDSHSGHLLDKALRLSTLAPGGRLLVLGAGAMGRLVAGRAAVLGFDVTVAARRAPDDLPFAFVELGRVPELPALEVIVGCLGSGAGEIAPRALPTARLLIDLGTPRNFNAPSGPGVVAISDMLEDERQRPHAMARRAALRERLAAILHERAEAASMTSRSPVGALRAEIEAIRRAEVARSQRLYPGISAEVLDTITRSLIDKVMHAPTARLKSLDEDSARAFSGLFTRSN